ncbi:HalOD1 output domain-containing protein [Haladaptatus sp. SPP-AMP-3]|uniref:HalOD1 output domain-containing protein n=1 Tax=Haladaptatus sp. SPP-AMP-3 TaxID=3121295 RepID=UPI003C302934
MIKHNSTLSPTTGRTRSHEPVSNRSKPLAKQVIMRVADEVNRSYQELIPLYEVIDPDALDNLFAPTHEGDARSDGLVEFEYAGCEIIVDSAGEVTVNRANTQKER